MNYDIFSPVGYASVAAWALVPILFLLHQFIRPRRSLCHIAVALSVAAFALAKVNSLYHVNRIEEDRSEEIARVQKAIEEARKRKEEERADDVADIRFAEDDNDDYLDVGGMDDGDRAYYLDGTGKGKKVAQEGVTDVPAWKRQKQTRVHAGPENSLEGAIGALDGTGGVDTSAVEEGQVKPIIMSAEDKDMANRLDAANLQIIRILIAAGLIYLLYDYLSRFNSYREAYLPLPLPAGLVNSVTPLPAIQTRSPKPRRSIVKELAFIARRGESFLYLTDSPEKADAVPPNMRKWPLGRRRVEILPVDFEGVEVSSDFVFDALWSGSCSFTVGSREDAEDLLEDFVELLEDRKLNRARAPRNVQVVWDMAEGPGDLLKRNMEILGPATGFSLLVCSG